MSDQGPVRSRVSPEEWAVRVELAACYRLVALNRWDDLIFTHISAKVPGPEKHFLINPYGQLFEEITASSLVKIDLDERARLVRDLGDKSAMILRNHGTLTVGETVSDAFMRMYFLERACEAQVLALAGGAELNPPPPGTPEKTAEQAAMGLTYLGRALAWPALLRKLDRLDPSFRA
jgi:ribulose-5-phosphate 4-epimerase/fuculose-1-phosphate aldolase